MFYPHRHSGPVIVAGSAACLHDDLAAARAIVGDVPVIAVNNSSREVKALALYSHHGPRLFLRGWIRNQRRLFGEGFTVHAREKHGHLEHVDFAWPIPAGGSSAWEGRKLAKMLGFELVILCGAPLDVGPYVGGHNLGGLMADAKTLDNLRRYVYDDTEFHEGVVSASGWTREVLGGLDASLESGG